MFESKKTIEMWVSCGDDFYYGKNGEKVDYEMAVYFYEKASKKKHPRGTYMLALCYELGQSVEQDLEYAEILFEKASKYGYQGIQKQSNSEKTSKLSKPNKLNESVKPVTQKITSAPTSAPTPAPKPLDKAGDLDLAEEYFKQGEYKKAFALCEPWARDGYDRAQFLLGRMYNAGRGVEKDHSKARYWFENAAQQGHKGAVTEMKIIKKAENLLGWVNEENKKKVEEKELERLNIYRQAAQLQDAGNNREAARLYEQIAQQDEMTKQVGEAALQLGYLYFSGSGVERNFDVAEKWLRKAVTTGIERAQDILNQLPDYRAIMLMQEADKLIESDCTQAIRLYKKILEEDNSYERKGDAACAIGVIYLQGGVGLEIDIMEGYTWFKKAAVFGNKDALMMLEKVYWPILGKCDD